MAQVTVRANLSNVQIPLMSEEFGRSVIVRQQDINYVPTVASKADLDKDVGIPQVYYAHNIVPTNYGYRSVDYASQIPAYGGDNFRLVYPWISATGEKAFLAFTEDGSIRFCSELHGYNWITNIGVYKATLTNNITGTKGYVTACTVYQGAGTDVYTAVFSDAVNFQVKKNAVNEATGTVGTEYVSANGKLKFTITAGTTAFASGDVFTFTLSAATFTGNITSAHVGGETYFASEGQGIFTFDPNAASNRLTWHYALGLESAQILGITAANGYLIVYSSNSVLWSSTINVLDFIPSLSTGAGGGSIENAKGPIRRCVALTSGFIVFTASNAVAAVYSQNIRYPFIFREIPNAGGIADLSLVTDEADSTAVYAYTTHGFQQITTTKASNVFPELSDFLTGKRFEDFDSNSLVFTVENVTAPLKKRIEFISGRYLIISYGKTSFTHAIIYDTTLQRFGKLKYTHVTAFQYGFFDADDADTPKKQVAFLSADGTVKTLEFTSAFEATDSVALIGKFQYIRSRTMTLEQVEIETVETGMACTCYSYATLDGKTFSGTPVAGYDTGLTGQSRAFAFHKSGLNHSLLIKGTFRLDSLVLTFVAGGDR